MVDGRHGDRNMNEMNFPRQILNWIQGKEKAAVSETWFPKLNPHNAELICHVTRSSSLDIENAVTIAKQVYPSWANTPPVQRGKILHGFAMGFQAHREAIARIVALETGKSFHDALGEVDGAIALGLFFAGEGQRLYGKTTTSGAPNKWATIVRQPVGIAGLIIAANTPIANIAWKVFPALICGNATILKAAEDTPITAWTVGWIAREIGLPPGIFQIIQGYGQEAGAPLVAHRDVGVISFTGSTSVGKEIAVECGKRLAKVSLELGGKNPLVVCDDADLENAAKWVVLSSFSNAGQRCAASGRIIVFDSIYESFRQILLSKTESLRVGPTNDDDLGPVINEKQLHRMVDIVQRAQGKGARAIIGGSRLSDEQHQKGFYMAPTFLENVNPADEISVTELFGPIACLYRVKDFDHALAVANDSPYGLTACIHTKNIHRAIQFSQQVQAGVVMVNAGTYGSEPHMPFGGLKLSGNGSREPGTEALDVYSEWKNICITVDPNLV